MLLALGTAAVVALVAGVLLVLVLHKPSPRGTATCAAMLPQCMGQEEYDKAMERDRRTSACIQKCPKVDRPVCDTSNRRKGWGGGDEYSNECEARCLGSTRWTEGKCLPPTRFWVTDPPTLSPDAWQGGCDALTPGCMGQEEYDKAMARSRTTEL